MVQLVKEKFDGFQITYKRAWLAKQKAIKLIYGGWEGSYEQLPKYMQALKESNPGTVVEWRLLECTVPGTHVFQRVFWAFKPCIDGFRHCRPLITIDGTHLYGKYKGTLLIAMGTDANFQLFPLAFAVVEGENNDSWSWFMACIRARVTDRKGLCVISDRHAGILAAMEEVGSGWEEPNAYHKYCTRHLASNVNSKFKSVVIKNLFGKAATARQKKKFDYYINKIGDLNVEARRYLMEIPYSKWSIHHDGGFRGLDVSRWHDLVEELLGVRPGHDDNGKPFLEGSTLKLTWLRRHFSQMPEGADDLTVQRHSRAYILTLMGSILFADKSGDAVSLYYLPFLRDWGTASTYSWGSATLGFLYRQLCRGCQRDSRQIGGPLILLQLWSWEHITIGRPYIRRPRDPPQEDPEAEDEDDILGTQHQRGVDPLACRWLRVHLSCAHTASGLPYYRDAFDHQHEDQMIWQPYTEAVMDRLPEICRSDMHIWRSRAPLICFDVVEFHLPDRVLRQFGLDQPIPQDVDTDVALHRKDRRGQRNWEIRHSDHVHEWSRREALVVQGYPFTGTSSPAMTEYMAWYRRITRLVITPPSQERPPSHYQPATSDLLLAHAFADLHVQLSGATETISHLPPETAIPFAIQTMQGFTSFCGQTLSRVGQSHLIQQPRPSTSSSSTVHTMPIRPPPHRGGHSARAFRPPTPSQHTIMTSPPLVHRQYQRNRRRSNTTSGVGVGLDDIPEETAASSSSSPHGKKQRPS
ncbi:serine/threonine-protein phosphatase 7 long form homolog [Chenopodium quinoa]|uniref:serine/threonine-protein phosphatase 7 long form homolog n=1 Tax=Chenopodium quinoa TaxID=63459 RepID=UPI000B78D4CB|nr:serine/threonine-protein phosphatase 7 long form homolog [Chenopodium quinoa]